MGVLFPGGDRVDCRVGFQGNPSRNDKAMYGRMTDIAEGEDGAGRAWTKRAAAQKGHARHAKPRRKFAS
jgi:hypothetical protein